MEQQNQQIRNFSIIAHIDHGKSTLADRMLELTHSVEGRRMKDQMLDSMELERERGITIKMQPVRMSYTSSRPGSEGSYTLNLIDTPGHIDFSYEVSRAMKAVEGAIMLVDATQGVQAQTLTTLHMAQELGLVIIPVLSKVDSDLARIDEVKLEVADLLKCSPDDVLETSGKTGHGVAELLEEVIDRVPAPEMPEDTSLKALVFDFEYSNHRGVIVYVRLFSGEVTAKDSLQFQVADERFAATEVGVFAPQLKQMDRLSAGEIGYIVTGIKEPGIASVGDTIARAGDATPVLDGYQNPAPVVWASIFPESQDDFDFVRRALDRLKLEDSSLSFEEESSRVLGRGFRCGFLGMLHLEIVTERLRRDFDCAVITTAPSTTYEIVHLNGATEIVYTPSEFPEGQDVKAVYEPVVTMTIITPPEYIGNLTQILYEHEATTGSSDNFGDNRTALTATMPLRELMRGFFDDVKRVSAGYASISYEVGERAEADVVRLDVLVADEEVPALTRITSRQKVEFEARQVVDQLYEMLPRQMFTTKIQARSMGRVLSSKTLSALKKDVTAKLYGGDITRKQKLWKKQKEGKKKMRSQGKVTIPHDVFLKMMRQQNSPDSSGS
ncbi:MAG: translation elongation factor 4 [Candidatus Paceibacterota bacterium]